MGDAASFGNLSNSIALVGPAAKVKATSVPVVDISVAPTIDFGALKLRDDLDTIQSHVLRSVIWELPAVLAGPIVRRAEPNLVYIWICTSVPVRLDASVFLSPDKPLGVGSTSSQPFGANVHVSLIPVIPANPLPHDVLLFYTMTLTATAGAFLGDVAFHESELAYSPATFPAFVLPSNTAPIVLMQGSCRKIHGPGADALGQGDDYVASAAHDLSRRPQQLLFTGDQVYADDVADGVLLLAQKLGTYLVGFDEMIPLAKPTPASSIAGGKGADQRGGLVRAAGFTSDADACMNHMIAFSDYMMLYLLGWSGDVWKMVSAQYPKLVSGGSLAGVQLRPGAAQRLMANVPTYMMCDDHEVTDDWFIDQRFFDSATKSPLLRRILMNALSNYCVFQAWGNQPDDFGARVTDIAGHVGRHAPLDSNADRLASALIADNWFFLTPEPASVVMMDTRTRRVLRRAPDASGLLDQSALGDIRAALKKCPSGQPVIIVSPPPVFGYDGLEILQAFDAHRSTAKFYEDDFETWAANPDVFFQFLSAIADSGRRQIVFFAGDVHYAYANSVAYCLPPLPGVEVLHLTSSSLKNKMSDWSSDKALVPESFTAFDAKNYGTHGAGTYHQTSEFDVAKSDPYLLTLKLIDQGSNVYLNWHFHDIDSGGRIVKTNSIGVFSLQRNAANPADPSITNLYIDENSHRYTTTGSWSQLMAGVQPSSHQSKWTK